MDVIELRALETTNMLIARAQGADEPVVVLDGEGECLIAMRPAVFERLLFDSNLLNCSARSTLHF